MHRYSVLGSDRNRESQRRSIPDEMRLNLNVTITFLFDSVLS